jgi:hypothetical protein
MLKKVKIKKIPHARTGYQVRGSLINDVPAFGGADYNAYIGKPKLEASKYITAVPREEANLEAEGGETVYGDINGDGMPEHKTIKGPRHSAGGVPLKLPDDTFIFSDTKSMRVKEPSMLAMFGKSSGSYTPAQLAKQYDIEKYRKILQDPNSDVLARKTAELMLRNYTLKLGALALAQESKKGFPQGIPAVAMPYMEAMGIKPEDILPDQQITNTIEQLDKQQSNDQRSAATMASPTEEQDEQYGDAAEEAQMMNSGRPVAQPEPEVDEAAGMTPEETQMQYGGMSQYAHGGWLPEEIAVFTGSVPYAEYGMPMGANPNNYEGRTRRIPPSAPPMFYARGGDLPKAQDGIEIDASKMSNEELQRAIWDAKQKDPNVKITIVKTDASGKVTKQNLKKEGFRVPTGSNLTEEELQGFPNTPDGKVAAAQYALIKKNLDNPTVRAEIIKDTKLVIDDPNAWKGKTETTVNPDKNWTKKYGALPTDDEIVNAALAHQKRNLMFRANGVDPQLFTDIGDKLDNVDKVLSEKYVNPATGKPYTREEAEKALKNLSDKGFTSIAKMATSLNVPLDPKGKDRVLQQSTMHAYAKSYKDFSDGKYKDNPDAQYAMNNFLGNVSLIHNGAADEKSMGALYGPIGNKISPLDDAYDLKNNNWYGTGRGNFTTYGDTTAGHQYMVGEYYTELEDIAEGPCQCDFPDKPNYKAKAPDGSCPCKPPATKPCPCTKADGTVIADVGRDPNTGECLPCEEKIPVPQPAEWWLQDTIKTTGAFGDLMGIKKQMPWAPRVDLETPRPTFLDPTRELAANAEQANIQTQGMAQFAGPQAASARASSIQGTAAKNAADILSKYNNANVNVANQFEMQSTNIRNQEQLANQGATQRMYDQNVIANQQFDNAKLAMRNNLRNQYTNAMTNRAKTDALNQMYPQYAVSPGTGGFMHFTQGKDFDKSKASKSGSYDQWVQYYKSQGMGDTDAINAAKGAMANTPQGGGTDRSGVINTMYGKLGGQLKDEIIKKAYAKLGGQMKKGGYVYADVTFPFVM